MIDLESLALQVKALAVETGGFIRTERSKFERKRVEKKHAHDYVSYVDKESESRIVTRLKQLLPEAGFIAEEGSAGMNGEDYCWLVDPLDGTTNFIHNYAPFCISIALKYKDELLLGVVYEICRDECFWTWKGASSYLNGKEIHVTSIDKPDDSFIALGLPYDSDHYKEIALKLLNECYGNVAGIRVVGAAAAELCYLAAGRFEARIEAFLGPWDIAAGTLILQNAGGRITDFDGEDNFASGRQVLASNGKIHNFLLDILNS